MRTGGGIVEAHPQKQQVHRENYRIGEVKELVLS